MAAVRLKGTLRHFTSLLLNLVDAATVFEYTGLFAASLQRTPHRTARTAKNRFPNVTPQPHFAAKKISRQRSKIRSSQGMVQHHFYLQIA